MNGSNHGSMPESIDECKKLFKLTRDFDLYLDMLNRLKSRYLIILCLKNTAEQNLSEETVEKIHRLGFAGFTAEPDMKYVGIFNNGEVLVDHLSGAYEAPAYFDVSIPKADMYISFIKEKEGEIKINGKNQSLNDKGINIVVYDLKKPETVDACCCNSAEGNPTFYHRNFYYDQQYIDTHIYIPERFKDRVTLPMRRSYFSDRRLNVTEVERGIFLPTKGIMEVDKNTDATDYDKVINYKAYGGICDESFKFIAGHQLFNPAGGENSDRHIAGSYKVDPKSITYMDETVLYGGSLTEHPGHLIVECFADRLWWLLENTDSSIKIAIQIIWEKGVWSAGGHSFVRELLDAFGVAKERLIFVDRPTKFKKIIIPDQSAIPLNYCFPYEFTSEYIKVFQHITKQLTPGKYKKIYFTKKKSLKNNTIGEEYFVDFFEKKGFKIIHPEDYTMKEKAELMYGAEEVVTVDGTSSLFAIFCKPSVRLTILTRRMDFWDTPHQLVNEAVGIKDFYLVNTSGNFLEHFSDDAFMNYALGITFLYATSEFRQYVKHIYNEELDITPEESMKKHLYDYLAFFPEYYSNNPAFSTVSSIKMTDILRSMSEVFLDKELNTDVLDFSTSVENRINKLERQLQAEKEAGAEKIKLLTDKAKAFIDENSNLKRTLAQRDAEIEQLRKSNAEMSSYVAEINSLLDSLEGNGSEE